MEKGLLDGLTIGVIKGSSDIFKELRAGEIKENKPLFYWYETDTKEVSVGNKPSDLITITVDSSCYPQNANKRRV